MGTMRKTAAQHLWDLVGAPFRFALLPQDLLPRFGWTTLEDERLAVVLPYVHGRLLDVGAGANTLVDRFGGAAVGVDVFDWGGGALLIEDAAKLPFANQSFDTVSCIAALNHIPNRGAALHEMARVLRPGGCLLLTMIDPILGAVGHAIWWHGEYHQRGGMAKGETGGLWTAQIIQIGQKAGFDLRVHQRFLCGLNHFYWFEKTREFR